MFTPFPSAFQFGLSNIQSGRILQTQHASLAEALQWSVGQKTSSVVDFEYNETRFEDDDMGIIGLCSDPYTRRCRDPSEPFVPDRIKSQ